MLYIVNVWFAVSAGMTPTDGVPTDADEHSLNVHCLPSCTGPYGRLLKVAHPSNCLLHDQICHQDSPLQKPFQQKLLTLKAANVDMETYQLSNNKRVALSC